MRDSLQIESIDDSLRNRLWNVILEVFVEQFNNSAYTDDETELGNVCKHLWKEFYKFPVDTIATYYNSTRVSTEGFMHFLRDWFFEAEWYELYDLIEFLAFIDLRIKRGKFSESTNQAFKRELAGYRLIEAEIIQITSDEEIQAIESALNITDKWSSVNLHLKSALSKLSDRKQPDYRNSIKESISSVEAFCIILTGDNTATLGKALAEIEKKHDIHKALKVAFSAIYGYTSDAAGIRHSLLESDKTVDLEDARFMLVSCSAFISYLKAKIVF
ncbi:hypothetical protein DYBT9623_00002 [Dyadobacter sp. CECT 9623]|uniref:HEPN AbiJ-N-terminal domain-containing protein n=1 Tax=Dyadobacter linearis TaxID=2823330 RepID=A0ABN7R1D3_9BACT|nr:hypothetical protein DYBT9623_00002 [Dyadobacter sp. CECT 9623]